MADDPKAMPVFSKVLLDRVILMLIPVLTASAPFALFSAYGGFSGNSASVAPAPGAESRAAGAAPAADPRAMAAVSSSAAGSSASTGAGPLPMPNPSLPLALHDEPVMGLAEALRFDVTTDWIVARWPRVSAGLSQLELQGYRVPLVTGTAEDDLAGALTYYFNPRQQVQRITFNGTTGNANKLLGLLASRYGFVHRAANDPSLFLYVVPEPGSKNDVKSFLWIRPFRVVTATEPRQRFEVALVLERPRQ